MEQNTLFDITPASTNDLTIGKHSKQLLSKSQQTFNRLLKKIEKLQKGLQIISQRLDESLSYFAKEIYPLDQEIVALRKEAVIIMYEFYCSKKYLHNKDKKVLKEILSIQLDDIFYYEGNEPSDELKAIFRAVEGISYEDAAKEEFNEMKEELGDILEDFGFNFSDINLDDSEEELDRKMSEKENAFKERIEGERNKQTARKKTAKQLQREEREKQIEEARKRNISSIYRQLAKVLHPDLEPDADRKIEKEALMQQLTVAYNNNDLHTLLKLELQWIHKENNRIEELSDEKLKIYNEVLKEQTRDLEMEQLALYQHPRYAPLQEFAFTPYSINLSVLRFEKSKRDAALNNLQESMKHLRGNDPASELKKIIEYFSRNIQGFNDY